MKVCKNENQSNGELHLGVRMGFSSFMIIISFILWVDNCIPNLKLYSLMILLGMIFSAIGDGIMAYVIEVKNRLVSGMTFFSLAHLFYIIGYIIATVKLGYYFSRIWIILILGYILIYALWRLLAYSKNNSLKLNIVGLIYALIIGTMALCALNLAILSNGAFLYTALGAILFILSDSLIAISEIQGKNIKYSALLVWNTYVIAQIFIVYQIIYLF